MNFNHECRLLLGVASKATYRSCISQVLQKDCVIRNHQRHERQDNRARTPPSGQVQNSETPVHSKHNDVGFTSEAKNQYVNLHCNDSNRPNLLKTQPGRHRYRSPFLAESRGRRIEEW